MGNYGYFTNLRSVSNWGSIIHRHAVNFVMFSPIVHDDDPEITILSILKAYWELYNG